MSPPSRSQLFSPSRSQLFFPSLLHRYKNVGFQETDDELKLELRQRQHNEKSVMAEEQKTRRDAALESQAKELGIFEKEKAQLVKVRRAKRGAFWCSVGRVRYSRARGSFSAALSTL